ncbi:MAG: hypothetical protein IPJ53_18365 [Saprospiraceae bacterium]|nr:hypothetical protein [Candidatus Vicinibacter affinis]
MKTNRVMVGGKGWKDLRNFVLVFHLLARNYPNSKWGGCERRPSCTPKTTTIPSFNKLIDASKVFANGII